MLLLLLQVVKAFVVLTSEFKTKDHDELRAELQAHVKRVTAPYKYPRKVRVQHLIFQNFLNAAELIALDGFDAFFKSQPITLLL